MEAGRRCGQDAAGTQENLPINCVNWYEAYAFCVWDGGFLPSRAEWEYAAVGGNQQRQYPWGTTDAGTGNQYAIYNCYYPSGGTGGLSACTGVTNIAPVGSAPLGAGLWGQLDLTGNLWQWTLETTHQFPNPCADCASVSTLLDLSSDRVILGANFAASASYLPPAFKLYNGAAPTDRQNRYGIRCARTP